MTQASDYLQSLGKRVLEHYTRLPGVACAAIIGSAAEGLSDTRSDLDLAVYYDTMPPEADLSAIALRLGGGALLWKMGTYADGEFAESFRMDGVECQVCHTLVTQWERSMEQVLQGHEPGSPLHKAMSGLLVAVGVMGAGRLEQWKSRAAEYSPELRLAMVQHHLRFFAIWGVWNRLKTRQAQLWYRQTLVDASFNILGVCAGLNRKYFTTFQFKRSGAFIDGLTLAPVHLGPRLEQLWHLPEPLAVEELRTLVRETVELVEREMPEVDTWTVRTGLARNDLEWAVPPVL